MADVPNVAHVELNTIPHRREIKTPKALTDLDELDKLDAPMLFHKVLERTNRK